MKRRDLIRHLERHGCSLDREGRIDPVNRFLIFLPFKPGRVPPGHANGRCAAVPRHREIKETTARAICDQLGIDRP